MERREEMDEERNGDSGTREEEIREEIPIDLNILFSGHRRDLNRLFPDARFKKFLRDVRKNQREVEGFLKRLESDDSFPEKPGGAHEVS